MKNREIDHGSAFDWGRTSQDYALYRDIYPEAFYRTIVELGLCTKGQRVLDLGTGTGVLPRNLYVHGAHFTGADVSANQIDQARRLAQQEGMDIDYVVAGAEDIDFAPDTFDVVTASQCFLYFDKAVALPKIHAVLREDGHFCVLWMAWLPGEDEIAAASEELVLAYNPAWTGGGFTRPDMSAPPEWAPPLFRVDHALEYDVPVAFTRESWHGRMKACRGIGASSLPPKKLAEFDEEHCRMLAACPESFEVLHNVSVLDLVRV